MSKGISFFHPASLIATCFGIGKIPFAPGTFGTIFGVVLIIILTFLPQYGFFDKSLLLAVFAICTVLLSFWGWWAAEVYSKATGSKDPKEVVIYEVAGIFLTATLIAVCYVPLLAYDPERFARLLVVSPYYLLVGFLLFRVFDITKLWHVGIVERKFDGGFGIMIDDLVAAIYAAIAFYLIFFFFVFSGLFRKIFYIYYPHLAGFV